jgi:hypothetical protein
MAFCLQQIGTSIVTAMSLTRETVAILAGGEGSVGIALCLANDGDTQVFMSIADAERFAKELERTMEAVKSAMRDHAQDAGFQGIFWPLNTVLQ